MASCLMPLGFYLLFRKGFKLINKVLFYFLCITLIIEIISALLSWNNLSNLWVYQIHSFIETSCFLFVFYLMVRSRFIWVFITVGFIGFSCVLVFEVSVGANLTILNPFSRILESVLMIFLSLYGFYKLLDNVQRDSIFDLSRFWYYTAILLYFSGNFFLFLFGDYIMQKSMENIILLYNIHSVLNVIFNLLITVTIHKKY